MFAIRSAAQRSQSISASCNEPEVVCLTERRRTLWPFSKTFAPSQPKGPDESGASSVIIIDLDELGATGSSQHGGSATASVGMHIFLSGLTVLAFYGAYASVNAIIDSTRALRSLSAQREALRAQLLAAGASDVSARANAQDLGALRRALRENDQARVQAHVHRIFMGGFGGIGATLVGFSILSSSNMLGAYAPTTLATASAPLMMAAAPIVTVFGAGIAGYEAYKFARTLQTSRRIPDAFDPNDADEARARKLLEQHLRNLRIVGGLKGGSYLGLAVGVPATVFGGPYGVPIMVVSAVGMVASGVMDGVMVGYRPQLTLQERMQLSDVHAIAKAVARADAERRIVKQKRQQDSARARVLACLDGVRREDISPCCTTHDVQRLVSHLLDRGDMDDFGRALLSHKSLRAALKRKEVVTKRDKEWRFDARSLATQLSNPQAGDEGLTEHTFHVADKMFKTTHAKRLLWRKRQLLDLLALEISGVKNQRRMPPEASMR